MTMKDVQMKEELASVPDASSTGAVFIRVLVPELQNQKCLQFQLDDTVWQAKQRVLAAFARDLRDVLNYGLYLPPRNGRAGKFLEEERLLKEYPLEGPIGFLEFKYKRRVYKTMQLNPRKLKQLHSKTNLKHFLEHVRNGNIDKINKMTSRGLDPNFHDHDTGETPLTVGATLVGKEKTREVLLALVSGGAHIDFRNRSGLTALHRAATVGNPEAIKTLLDLGASPDLKDGKGLTPLYHTVSNDTDQACTEMLLHERAFVGTPDDQGWCEIHQACRYGRVQHLEHLLFYGAEIDVQNSSGSTPLHVCAAYKQEACARVLLFRGADRSILNFSNQTAYDVAVVSDEDLADLILNHKDEDVVPIREMPHYSDRRRKHFSSVTPSTSSMQTLLRSRSDPRLHASVLQERMLQEAAIQRQRQEQQQQQQQGLTSLQEFYDTVADQHGGYAAPSSACVASYASSRDYYSSDSPCSLSLSSAGSGSVMGVADHGYMEGRGLDGREGYFPASLVEEVRLRRVGSVDDLMNDDTVTMRRDTLAALLSVDRENVPRVAVLHRSAEGYGFVLRGAKSHSSEGTLNFQPTPEFPALQYLDSVDPGGQSDRAGLRGGDFILEINGENVTRASHERVVQLIRTSGDVLALKVVSPVRTPSGPIYSTTRGATASWYHQHGDGSMTLPSRTKKPAPLPPQRDPRTSLSYSKATSKSMSEGLAEIEQLDQAIAEFDQQPSSERRHSLHSLDNSLHQSPPSQHKVASVRAAHTMKRVSVIEMMEIRPPSPPPEAARPLMDDPYSGTINRAEMKQKKQGKQSNPIERSKSSPDLADIDFSLESEAAEAGAEGGADRLPRDKTSATWSKSKSIYVPALPGMSVLQQSGLLSDLKKKHTDGDQPHVPDRAPFPKRRAPDPPAKGEVVKINTAPTAQSAIYANVSAEIAARKKESPYESSFRPGTSAQLTDIPSVMTKSLEQAKLQHKKINGMDSTDLHPKSVASNHPPKEHVYETTTLLKKHPNATLLVQADIHESVPVKKPEETHAEQVFYEPEPDYDADSGDEVRHSSTSTVTTVNVVPERTFSKQSVSAQEPTHSVHDTTCDTLKRTSNSAHKDSAPAVTVISIGKQKSSTGSPLQGKSVSVHSNVPATEPKPTAKHSPDSAIWCSEADAVKKTKAVTSSSASSTSSDSRRSSQQSNISAASSSHDTSFGAGREGHPSDPPALSSNIMLVHQNNTDEVIHHTPPPDKPPPPPPTLPPSLSSHPPPPPAPPLPPQAPPPPKYAPPPPPPPLPTSLPPSTSLSLSSTAHKPASESDVSNKQSSALGLIPTSDILAAVAQRRARMETDGPRVTDRHSAAPSMNAKQRNQEALKAAIAQRRSMLEKMNETCLVDDIEARLNKNRKLQSAKFFSSKDNQNNKAKTEDGVDSTQKNPTSSSHSRELPASSNATGDKSNTKPTVSEPAAKVNNEKPVSGHADKPKATKSVIEPTEKPQITTSVAELTQKLKAMKQVSNETTHKPKEILTHKAPSSKAQAPRPPVAANKTELSTEEKRGKFAENKASKPQPPTSSENLTVKTSTTTTFHKASTTSKGTSNTTPLPKIGTIKSNDFLALAEKARQEYLQKIGSAAPSKAKTGDETGAAGKDTTTGGEGKKTPIGTSKAQPTVIKVQPAKEEVTNSFKISVRDKVGDLESSKGNLNVKGFQVSGVTEDHSHTEPSLSNGTLKRHSNSNGTSAQNSVLMAPPADFSDGGSSKLTQIDIIPPPPSFAADMIESSAEANAPAFNLDDTASFVSSASSLSTLSSEQGDTGPSSKAHNHYDDIIVPPPPPPDFSDEGHSEHAYDQVLDNFIPPPAQFTADWAQKGDNRAGKTEHPFHCKAVDTWTCADVLDWLDSLELSQYKSSFARNAVDGAHLQALERNDYIELGVTQVGHRMDLQRSIKRMMLRNSNDNS